jgi:hypothetical protein
MIRATLVRLSAALWGLAIAISLLPSLTTPATPEQLPGLAKLLGIDAHAPMRFVIALILLPIIFAAAATPLSRAMGSARSWSRNALCIAMTSALWIATVHPDVWWTTIPIALFVIAFVALRNVDAHFTRRDVILVPAFLTLLIAFTDLLPSRGLDLYVLAAAALTLVLRLIARDPLRFTFAPLALIAQTPFLSWDQRHLGWPSIAIVVLSVIATRFITKRRALQTLIAFVIYPLAAYSYTTATSLSAAEGKPRANVFEDAHGLLPASQMLRGERPYRDVIPGHGLLEDGLLDYLAVRSRDATYGHALKTRATIGALNSVAIYALATAATGSPEAGFIAFLFGAITGSSPPTTRTIPALFALALIVAAVRRRKPRLLFGAGLLAVVAGITSLDFAAYTFVTLVVAMIRFRPRMPALRAAASGIAVGVTILAIALASFGTLGAFIRTTFIEIPSLGPAYAMNPFTAPAAFKSLRYFPEVIAAFFDRGAYLYLVWLGALLLVAMTIAARARRRIEPLVLIALWITLCAISYAERHHLHFQFAVAPLLIVTTFMLFRARQRVAAIALTATLFVIAQPTTHVAVLSMLRHAHGPLDERLVEVGLPRARGAYFTKHDAAAIDSVKRYADSSLAPNETFFDFTNRGLLYFLLDRDSPIRQIEVPQYETDALQHDVIARIETNPRVRVAIVPAIPGASSVDGVPNELRAPLVWQYLQTHFEPAFSEGEVAIWRRK